MTITRARTTAADHNQAPRQQSGQELPTSESSTDLRQQQAENAAESAEGPAGRRSSTGHVELFTVDLLGGWFKP